MKRSIKIIGELVGMSVLVVLVILVSSWALGQIRENDETIKRMVIIIVAISTLMLLFAISFVFFMYREKKNRMKDLVQLKTQHLLRIQENTNKDLKSTNATLQASEEKLAVTLGSIGDAVMTTDALGCITLLNPLAEKLTGWTHEEALGRPFEEIFNIINEETRESAAAPIMETLKTGSTLGLRNQTLLVAHSGVEHFIADSCAPIRDQDSLIIGAILVFRDVTQQKKLEESHGRLAAIVASADDAIIGEDIKGKVLSWNGGAERSYGYTAEEMVGKSILTIIPDDLVAEYQDMLKKIALGEEIKHYETQRRAKDGKIIDVSLSIFPVSNSSDKIISVSTIARDISERKETEKGLKKSHDELLILTEELKRVAMVKSEFLANVSHELRTPLNSINGFSEVLFDETFGPLNEKQKIYVNNILSSGNHLLLLINQILNMTKVESGKMKLLISNLNINHFLHDISLLFEDLAAKKNIQILLDVDEHLPLIEGDELKVKEVIYNLLSNAEKFSTKGGSIGIRARQVGDDVEVVVSDTGIGLAPENIEKVFEGFFRVDSPYTRATEGTGLGLPLTKKMVELHGGSIYLTSEGLGKGLSVRFTLPIKAARSA